jgi:hypothetical protein
VCDGWKNAGALITRAPEGYASNVGVNGDVSASVGGSIIEGSWRTGGSFSAVGSTEVRDTLHVDGDLSGTGSVRVGEDVMVGGDLKLLGHLKVGGDLGVGGSRSGMGYVEGGNTASYAPAGKPPCPCAPGERMDVAKMVAQARAKADNGKHNVPTSLATIGATEVRLSGGRYVFEDIQTIGAIRFVIEGAVQMYLDGDLEVIGAQQFKLKSGATLDRFVAGSVKTTGAVERGADASPSSFRLYVGGKDAMVVTAGAQRFRGMVYAPEAEMSFAGATDVEGSLFAKNLRYAGLLTVHGSPVVEADGCGRPPRGSGSGNSGGSSSGSGDGASAGSSGGASGGSTTDGSGSTGTENPTVPSDQNPTPILR